MEIIDLTEKHPARKALEELASRRDDYIDLAAGALLIAAEDLDLDEDELGAARLALNEIVEAARKLLPDEPSLADRLATIHKVLFEEMDMSGDEAGLLEPGGVLLPVVLSRRQGLPVGLAVVYVTVAESCGLEAHGVAFPGHFLVRCEVEDGMVIVDPFNGGRTLDVEDCRELLAMTSGESVRFEMSLLEPATHRHLLTRVLAHLRGVYLGRSDEGRALMANERMVVLNPKSTALLRDRAALYWRLGRPDRAASDLERVLTLDPFTEEADDVRRDLERLRTEGPWLN